MYKMQMAIICNTKQDRKNLLLLQGFSHIIVCYHLLKMHTGTISCMPPSFNSLLAIRSGAGVGLNHISTLKSNFDVSGNRCCIMFIMFEHVHTSYNDNYSFSNATLIQMHLNDFNENTHKTYDRKGYIAIVGYTLLLDLQLYAKEHD